MPSYLHPGVYVEEIPSGVKPIEGVGTSTAAFIGFTTKGAVEKPELILRFDDYVDDYGGLRDLGNAAVGDRMGLAVSAFFQNGGTKAYIGPVLSYYEVVREGDRMTDEGWDQMLRAGEEPPRPEWVYEFVR